MRTNNQTLVVFSIVIKALNTATKLFKKHCKNISYEVR